MGEGTIAQVLAGEATWTVVLGDCLDVLPTLPDRSVAHVITDPPYSEHTHSKSRSGSRMLHDGSGRTPPASFSRAAEFGFVHLSSRLRSFVSAHVARLVRRWSLTFSDVESATWWRLAMVARGLDYVRTGVWHKIGSTPQFTGDRPAVACEAITICHPTGRKRWNRGGGHGIWQVPIELDRGGTGANARLHTTQKPLALMEALVADFTDPADIILDPFAGSGTTGVAAIRLGRRFIGIEREPKYHAIAVERLRAEEDGSTLRARRAGQLPMFGKV